MIKQLIKIIKHRYLDKLPVQMERLIWVPNIALSTAKSYSTAATDREYRKLSRQVDPFGDANYYFENGLRKVYPYHYTYKVYCKKRWIQQQLLNVFKTEFIAAPLEEYKHAIESGRITVNGLPVEVNYILKDGDLIRNTVHRHELPVVDQPIKIVHLSNSLVVVDKPCSIPVHPVGRYHFNSLEYILGKEFELTNLRPAHRLDRLTSGLIMFGRTLNEDQKLKREMRERRIQKEYLCRVEGVFPSNSVVCKESISILSRKYGICRTDPEGRASETHFNRLSCNGKSSLVLCKPLSGRFHQIRVHLQYLGYPIVNDPIYNHSAFGPEKGKLGNVKKTEDELIGELARDNVELQWLVTQPFSNSNLDAKQNNKLASPKVNQQYYDSECAMCTGRVQMKIPTTSELVMYLHCWKYKGPDWAFETKMPKWALEDWQESKD